MLHTHTRTQPFIVKDNKKSHHDDIEFSRQKQLIKISFQMKITLLIFCLSLTELVLPDKALNTTMYKTIKNTTGTLKYPFMNKPILEESKSYSGCLRGEDLESKYTVLSKV